MIINSPRIFNSFFSLKNWIYLLKIRFRVRGSKRLKSWQSSPNDYESINQLTNQSINQIQFKRWLSTRIMGAIRISMCWSNKWIFLKDDFEIIVERKKFWKVKWWGWFVDDRQSSSSIIYCILSSLNKLTKISKKKMTKHFREKEVLSWKKFEKTENPFKIRCNRRKI
jgi:hypothetical protein